MSTFEIVLLILLMVSPIVVPLVVFASVKLATGAYLRTRERYYQEFQEQERENENDNDTRKA